MKRIISMMFVFGVSMFFAGSENTFAQRKSVSGKEVAGLFVMNITENLKAILTKLKFSRLATTN